MIQGIFFCSFEFGGIIEDLCPLFYYSLKFNFHSPFYVIEILSFYIIFIIEGMNVMFLFES